MRSFFENRSIDSWNSRSTNDEDRVEVTIIEKPARVNRSVSVSVNANTVCARSPHLPVPQAPPVTKQLSAARGAHLSQPPPPPPPAAEKPLELPTIEVCVAGLLVSCITVTTPPIFSI